jgi:prepilin-type N-terminal cleavage/methylation domain-containing protein
MTRERSHMRHDKGLTLLECLIAISLLAMCVIALTIPTNVTAGIELEDARRTLAGSLATEMMEEILTKDFDDPDGSTARGPEWDEYSRSRFDNMDDYHGYAEPAGAVLDMHGDAMIDPAGLLLSREVTVEYVYLPGQDISQPCTFARIKVAVTREGDALHTLTRLAYRDR